jgi:hypothetical protein
MEQHEMKRKLIWDDASDAFNWYAESLCSDIDVEKYLDGKWINLDGERGIDLEIELQAVLPHVKKLNSPWYFAFGNHDICVGGYLTKSLYLNILRKNNSNFTFTTPYYSFVPKQGDIMVWNKRRGNGAGHVAICTGKGTTSYFYSLDLNWNGHKYVEEVKHDYKNIYGAKVKRQIIHRPLPCGNKHYPFCYLVRKNKPRHGKTEAFSSLFSAFFVKIRANNKRCRQKHEPKNMRAVEMRKAEIFRHFIF